MDSVNLIFEKIKMSLDIVDHRLVNLSQKLYACLKGTPSTAMDYKMDILTDDHSSFYLYH